MNIALLVSNMNCKKLQKYPKRQWNSNALHTQNTQKPHTNKRAKRGTTTYNIHLQQRTLYTYYNVHYTPTTTYTIHLQQRTLYTYNNVHYTPTTTYTIHLETKLIISTVKSRWFLRFFIFYSPAEVSPTPVNRNKTFVYIDFLSAVDEPIRSSPIPSKGFPHGYNITPLIKTESRKYIYHPWRPTRDWCFILYQNSCPTR